MRKIKKTCWVLVDDRVTKDRARELGQVARSKSLRKSLRKEFLDQICIALYFIIVTPEFKRAFG